MYAYLLELFSRKFYELFLKPYNLTYFITFIAVATFTDHKYVPSHRKRYKMFYIGGFIMKTFNFRELNKLIDHPIISDLIFK